MATVRVRKRGKTYSYIFEAGRLGHKRVEMTDEIYTHNTDKIQQDTEKAFEKTLEKMQTKR